MQQAERGMQELLESVDTMLVIPNEKLLAVARDAGFFESFRIADDVLRQGVQGISDIITIPGIINRDFADVKTTMAGMGYAVMGTGISSGTNRAVEAAMAAMASPLLEAGAIDGARGILINITASNSIKLSEVNEASSIIQSAAHEDANIIFGAVQDESMGDEIKITVIATGFKQTGSAEMNERRERMLSEASLPEYVPEPIKVQSRPAPARRPEPETPRFASEEFVSIEEVEDEEVAPPLEKKEELRAVPASVFDDEFFRSTVRSVAERETEAEAEAQERHDDVSLPSAVQYEREEQEREAARMRDAELRMQMELAAEREKAAERAATPPRVPEPPHHDQESDELDIPAFLRRSSS
jgi:cell division protein FtsZ